MNWEALGAIGEIVGAIAVVVTLGYLAVQIRQNTRTVRASTNHALTVQRNEANYRFGLDPSAAALLLRGARDRDQLDFEERYRHRLLMRAVIGTFEDVYVQFCEGLCDEETWENTKVVLRPVVSEPGFLAWWKKDGEIFKSSFRTEIEALARGARAAEVDGSKPKQARESGLP
jgi:hypothetical protein